MEHIAALLLIVGCSPDLAECRELPAPVPVFETAEECDAVLPAAFRQYEGGSDKVFARCIEVDPILEEMDAELVWDVTFADGLVASVEPLDAPYDEPETHIASHNEREGVEAVVR